MSVDFLLEFVSACLLMGLGIGLDAAMVTSLRASAIYSRVIACGWVVSITFTHTVFPMVGYLLSHTGAKYFPALSPFVGLLAFLLIGYYLFQEIVNHSHADTEGQSDQGMIVNIGLILAVSWDALWSGPAKSAQVIHWPEVAVFASFLLVGLFVALLCVGALLVAQSGFIRRYLQSSRWFSTWDFEFLGRWCQYSVFSYFGLLALTRYTFQLDIAYELILLFCAIAMALVLKVMSGPRSRGQTLPNVSIS